ncbi:MAG: hypothetical protein K8T26_11145 [Lentisphaerae bacterium]|nr:hypothetical protein [Lentisphaerota bacterium]
MDLWPWVLGMCDSRRLLMLALDGVQDINHALIALYRHRLARSGGTRGRTPRWQRRTESALRAAESAAAKTGRAIEKLRRHQS